MKQHSNEKELMKFIESSNDRGYTLTTIEWLKKNYPGSAPRLEPQLRRLADKQIKTKAPVI